MRNKRWIAMLTSTFLLLIMPIYNAFAKQPDGLHIVGSCKADGSLQVVMSLCAEDAPTANQVRVSFSGLGIPDFQFYPYENTGAGTSICIIPDIGSSSQGRGMQDARILINRLVDGMAAEDNACILTNTETKLTNDPKTLRQQTEKLRMFTGDRRQLLSQALECMATDENAYMRKMIVILSDGASSGAGCADLADKVNASRIPLFYVSLSYGSDDPARISADKMLSGFANASRGGAGYAVRLFSDSAKGIADQIQQAMGTGYVLELSQDTMEKYFNPEGGVIKIELDSGNETLSDTLPLTPSELPAGVYMPGTDDASFSSTSESAAPAASVSDSADNVGDAAAVSDASKTSVDAFRLAAWFSAQKPSLQLALCGSIFVVILAAILLLVIRPGKRARSEKRRKAVAQACSVTMPVHGAEDPAVTTPAPTVHLRLIRLEPDDETVLEIDMVKCLTIGSDPSKCQWIPEDAPMLEKQDCRLEYENDRLSLIDLTGRSNGAVTIPQGGSVYIGGVPYQIYWKA